MYLTFQEVTSSGDWEIDHSVSLQSFLLRQTVTTQSKTQRYSVYIIYEEEKQHILVSENVIPSNI